MTGTCTILQGDCVARMRELQAGSVHCVVTSPPYLWLRDYGVEGQIGLEATVDEYVQKLVDVFREVRRILREDGTCWINLGDSYATGGRGGGGAYMNERGEKAWGHRAGLNGWRSAPEGLKHKDIIGLPWRVAFALQSDGWRLRGDHVWWKTNAHPESVQDRPTRAHEFVFLLTKSAHYFYDSEAVREPVTGNAHARGSGVNPKAAKNATGSKQNSSFAAAVKDLVTSRNLRSVWAVPTQPFAAERFGLDDVDHYAVMPEEIARRCILAGTSERGACPRCGAQWQRIVEVLGETARERMYRDGLSRPPVMPGASAQGLHFKGHHGGFTRDRRTLCWEPRCDCEQAEPIPATVFDPFGGAATTALVALKNGRSAILTELNPAYVRLAEARIEDWRKSDQGRQIALAL